jgi:hypothetical protein
MEIVEKKYRLNKTQQNILMNSFIELQPYLSSYYPIYHFCPKTKLQHVSVVFNFNPDLHLDISSLSEETRQTWELTNMQDVLNRKPQERWNHGCTVLFGIPPIQRNLPSHVIREIFGDEHHKFHLEASIDCF